MASYLERKLASQDKRFQAALAEADALFDIHQASRGAEFEDAVRSIFAGFLPYTYQVHDGFMRPVDGLKKQLDVVIRSRLLPELLQEVPVELITVAGEVKTTLSSTAKGDYLTTANKLASAAASAGRRRPLPFFVLAGALGRPTGHATWLASMVREAATATSAASELWPAAFSFDPNGPMSAIPVGPLAPLSAVTSEGEALSGVISITDDQLSPSAVCYLWLWACLPVGDSVPGMELRAMWDAVYPLTDAHGIVVSYRHLGAGSDIHTLTVSLLLTGDDGAPTIAPPVRSLAVPSRDEDASGKPEAIPASKSSGIETGNRRFMLITLGSWVTDPDSWDESLWGGSGTAHRNGYGYYEGMTDQELLDASRLFWRFKPSSKNWEGVRYALVAHAGTVRSVLEITKMIGPLWGRYGFQGHVLKDSKIAREMIGSAVPTRQNPITTIEL